jgi:glycosyltransferase involved in cell wall biosynthesis
MFQRISSGGVMRILFVANVWSIHAARWISQISDQNWNIHIFPTRDLSINPIFNNVVVHDINIRQIGLPSRVRTPGANYIRAYIRKVAKKVNIELPGITRPDVPDITDFNALDVYSKIQGRRLAALIARIKPDIIHSLQFQFDSYPTLEARKIFGEKFPTWIVANWGADIHYFGDFPDHAKKIREVLANCDYYSCECYRDSELARKFGFQGEILPIIPNTGGYNLRRIQELKQKGLTSERKLIALKGYKDWVYRGLVGLEALGKLKNLLIERDYKVCIYIGGTVMKEKAEYLGVPFEMIPYSPHEEILKLHGHARISIGLSMSDAVSTSFLEALVMGSFPIQSNTSCADEWITNGETGFLVPPEDPILISEAIEEALTNDYLVDHAAIVNEQTIKNRLDQMKIKPTAVKFYTDIKLKRVI